MIPDATDPIGSTVSPKFQTFVTWVFYAAIVFIGWSIIGRFQAIETKLDAYADANVKNQIEIARFTEWKVFTDNDLKVLKAQVSQLESRANKHINKGER